MASYIADLPLLYTKNRICLSDRGESVCNEDNDLVRFSFDKSLHNAEFVFRIELARPFIEDE